MTSTVRRCSSSRGFTLLEIVITLTFASIIIGGAIGLMRFSSSDRDLKLASTEIETLAKRARAAAILHQAPYAIEFTQNSVRLMPLAELLGQDLLEESDPFGEQQPTGAARSSFALDGGIALAIRRWNARDWDEVGKDEVHLWRFDPDGLCEPLGLRLALEDNVAEYEFHPLTATIQNLKSDLE